MIECHISESPNDGQFYARFQGDNGEPWFVSEGYTRRADAQRSVLTFMQRLGKGVTCLILNFDAEGNRV